jgi:hypothetical protein
MRDLRRLLGRVVKRQLAIVLVQPLKLPPRPAAHHEQHPLAGLGRQLVDVVDEHEAQLLTGRAALDVYPSHR